MARNADTDGAKFITFVPVADSKRNFANAWCELEVRRELSRGCGFTNAKSVQLICKTICAFETGSNRMNPPRFNGRSHC